MEKDITEKINDLGYKVITCNVYATLSSEQEENYIDEIALNVEKSEEQEIEKETIEDKLVNEIQKIKPVNTTIGGRKQGEKIQGEKEQSINNQDVEKIKKFLTEEYGVEERCLKIN